MNKDEEVNESKQSFEPKDADPPVPWFERRAYGGHYQDQPDRAELANEFRAAVDAAKLERVLPAARSCDWCGIDLYTIDDHKAVDRQHMCNPCYVQYFQEQGQQPTHGMER